MLLELTFIYWAGWSFEIDLHFQLAAVIWAIGWSMIVLAALIHLPLWAVATIGVTMIVGHNALDSIQPQSWGGAAWLWQVLHAGGPVQFAPGHTLFVGYPLLPWMGVMAAAYAFGRILLRERAARRAWIMRLGIVLTLAFVALRFSNLYGDARPWTAQPRPGFALLSFLDCTKYPPSLCYLLMTLGPAMIVLALLDRGTPAALKPFLVFGRVPLFYYLLYIPLIHGLAVLIERIRFGHAPWLFGNPFGLNGHPTLPPNAGLSLVGVYTAWIAAILILYPVCKWFAGVKHRRREAWQGYL